MASPELQTVLTLTRGTSDQKTKTFRWGTAVPPIPVGTRAEWYVHAPGVVGVHLYVAFDGRMVHVAAAAGARVTVRGVEVGQEWTSVPVRTEVRFGDAAISVTCEEVPKEAGPTTAVAVDARQLGTGFTTAPPPSPGLVRTLIVREAKPPAPPLEQKPAAAAGAGAGNTRPMGVAASAVAAAPTIATPPPPAPAAPQAHPAVLPTAIISAAAFTPAGTKPAAPMRPVALEPPAPGDVTPPPPAPSEPPHESSPTTMIDGGALRDHAHRIANMPPAEAEAAAQEYAALLKRRAGRSNSDPPELTMSFGQGPENKRKPVAAAPPAERQQAAIPVAAEAKVIGFKERMARSWKETSNVKKAILFLLPLAAAATLLERDPEPEEPPAPAKQTQVASAVTAKRATGDTPSPAASQSATSAPVTSASGNAAPSTTVPPAAASAPAPSGVPAIPAASAKPVASAQAFAAPSAAVVATASFATASPAKIAANDPSKDKRNAQADDEPDPDQRASMLAHMALAAAFGGNLAQATTLYAKLAEVKPDAQVFALAARLTKEGAVRTP